MGCSFINMITQLTIREHNKEVYKELVKDMVAHGNGLFSFIIRVSAGEIVDYVVMDNIPPEAFLDEPAINITHNTT